MTEPSHISGKRRYKFTWRDKFGAFYSLKGVKFNDWKDLKRFVDSIGGTVIDCKWI